jgi:hypothetical protein
MQKCATATIFLFLSCHSTGLSIHHIISQVVVVLSLSLSLPLLTFAYLSWMILSAPVVFFTVPLYAPQYGHTRCRLHRSFTCKQV